MYSARARLAAWRRRRIDALVPLQIRWHRASGGRRTAVAVLALLPLSLAAVVGVSLLPSVEGEPRSAPSATSVSDGVLPEAVGTGPAREGNPSRPQPRNAASAAAGLAGVGVSSAAAGPASAPAAPFRAAPDAGGAPDAGDAPDSGGAPNFGGAPDPGGAPNSAPAPPRDFDSDGRPNPGPRAHVPSGGGPGTREPSGGAPHPGAPSGDDGAAPPPAPALPLPSVPLPEVPSVPPVDTTPLELGEDGGTGNGGGNGGGNGPPPGGPPGQGDGDGGGPDGD